MNLTLAVVCEVHAKYVDGPLLLLHPRPCTWIRFCDAPPAAEVLRCYSHTHAYQFFQGWSHAMRVPAGWHPPKAFYIPTKEEIEAVSKKAYKTNGITTTMERLAASSAGHVIFCPVQVRHVLLGRPDRWRASMQAWGEVQSLSSTISDGVWHATTSVKRCGVEA